MSHHHVNVMVGHYPIVQLNSSSYKLILVKSDILYQTSYINITENQNVPQENNITAIADTNILT